MPCVFRERARSYKGLWSLQGFALVGLALSRAGSLPQGLCVVAGIQDWPRGFSGLFIFRLRVNELRFTAG